MTLNRERSLGTVERGKLADLAFLLRSFNLLPSFPVSILFAG
jgi:hypothetical protein